MRSFHAVSVAALMATGTFSGNVLILLIEIRENPEFHGRLRMDKSHWPRCLFSLSGVTGGSPQAGVASDGVGNLLECASCSYSSHLPTQRDVLVEFDKNGALGRMQDNPNIWPDGSLVLDKACGVSSFGSGFLAHRQGAHHDMVQPAHGNVVVPCEGVLFSSWNSADSSNRSVARGYFGTPGFAWVVLSWLVRQSWRTCGKSSYHQGQRECSRGDGAGWPGSGG